MEVYFIRHGLTEWNGKGVFQGRTDVPLCETGREQARAARERILAKGIEFDRVISSPLCRARETASIVSGWPYDDVQTDERLFEMAFGVMEGTDFYKPDYPGHELTKKPFGGLFEDPAHFEAPEGAETFLDVVNRTGAFLDMLRDPDGYMKDTENLLVASHGAAIRAILINLNKLQMENIWRTHILNCSLYHYRFTPGSVTEIPEKENSAE